MDNKTVIIDESLYSRQLLTLGKDAMGKITKTDVIICGPKGSGLELARFAAQPQLGPFVAVEPLEWGLSWSDR